MNKDNALLAVTRMIDEYEEYGYVHTKLISLYDLRNFILTIGEMSTDNETGLVPCGCKYCDLTHGQRYLFRENKNAPYRGMISTVEIAQGDCKNYSQIESNLYDENGNNFYSVFEIRYCPMCGRKI